MDSKLEISLLEQSNPSRSLPKSSTTETTTVDEDTNPSTESLTPDQCKTLEYLNMTQILFPDVKEIKRSSLTSSCESLGDLDNLMTSDPLQKVSLIGAECYRNFLGFNFATQVTRDVVELYGALQTACERGAA